MTEKLFETLSHRICNSIEDLLEATSSHERKDDIRTCIQKCQGKFGKSDKKNKNMQLQNE